MDGIVNVTDIVQMVGVILNGGTARVDDATNATLTIAGFERGIAIFKII